MNVRPRALGDLEELVEVAARVRKIDGYPVYLRDNDFRLFLTRPIPLDAWVAEANGHVVGHVALNSQTHPAAMAVVREAGFSGEVGVVARLLVDPVARRQGLGTRLLERAQAEAVEQGRVPVLDVLASAATAINLYLARGWQQLGRCEFEIPGHGLVEEIIFAAPC